MNKRILSFIVVALLLIGGAFLIYNNQLVEAVSYNFKDDANVESSINSYLKDGNLVIEYDNPNNEKVWVEGLLHKRFLINEKKVIIYDYQPNEVFELHIGEESDVYGFGRPIGYQFLDNNEVVHIWNTQDDYFFDVDSGIQFTNHYEDYWTRNIFCLGYYNSGQWNKIACADELNDFNKDIQTDNETYVNATLWKDISYGVYDLRLGVRYHLGLDDKNLSITIYGKNLGIDIPYDLGFAWKITNWEIPHEDVGGDSIFVNNTDYELDGTFDLTFKDMQHSYFDDELNETVVEYDSYFRGYDWTKFLRVDWNENLNYAIKMYGDGNQSNFYVVLLINAGHFNPNQEKSTTFKWIDAEGDYTGEYFTPSYPHGIEYYNNYLYIPSDAYDRVDKYTTYGSKSSVFDLVDGNDVPHGVTTNGTFIWVGDILDAGGLLRDGDIYKYLMDGTYVSNWSTSIDGCAGPWAITNNNTFMWVACRTNASWAKYDMDGNFIELHDIGVEAGNDYPTGITTNGTFIWVGDQEDDVVYKYLMNGTYTNDYYDIVGSGATNCWGITQNGEYFWVADRYSVVYKYVMDETPFSPLQGVAKVYLNLTGERYAFKLTWEKDYSGNSDEFGGIVIENDIGYTVAKGDVPKIVAFNATTGKLIWMNALGGSDGTPIIDNQGDYIYINTIGNGIYKLNKTNGTSVATNHTCNPSFSDTQQSMAQSDNLIFDGCLNGYFYAYNKDELTVNWSFDSGAASIDTTPAYFEDSVIFGDYNHIVFKLNATTGSQIWNYTISQPNFCWDVQPSILNDTVYIGSLGETVALNFTTGVVIWENAPGAFTQYAIYDNKLYFGSSLDKMYVRNISDGTEICTFETGGDIYQGPSISAGIAFFGSLDNYFYAMNATNCDLLWKYEVGGDVFCPPAIAQGNIYFKADDYKVYSFDLGNGTGDWKQIGYDDSGVSYCADCLTDFQGIKSTCTSISSTKYNCTIENDYTDLTNVSLVYTTPVHWYNVSNDLLSSSTIDYNFTMPANFVAYYLIETEITSPTYLGQQTNTTIGGDAKHYIQMENIYSQQTIQDPGQMNQQLIGLLHLNGRMFLKY
jgi:outer membrane protein assembly factor BamB